MITSTTIHSRSLNRALERTMGNLDRNGLSEITIRSFYLSVLSYAAHHNVREAAHYAYRRSEDIIFNYHANTCPSAF